MGRTCKDKLIAKLKQDRESALNRRKAAEREKKARKQAL
jgi:hypothetical protein